ncbi:hypothetical protein BAE44_0021006 [Dichanthelium oligosanthes]|uniref:Uncharacterized protein n=1 Tax=Dichanthelium oligosanthes TaxID=888268 RepID=A0A1E5UYX4_9POAL|nr:hypothetical protein BAE44_0021006 [Dichanthelium oligosanthes]
MGRASTDALAMAGADWTRYCVDDEDEEEDGPPEHLRAFEAFLETVVPVDMVLAFWREEAGRGERRRRSHQKDVEDKLKLWAKAVARESTKGGVLGRRSQQAAGCLATPCPRARADNPCDAGRDKFARSRQQ